MSSFRKYRLNPETLLYEIERASVRSRAFRVVFLTVASAAMSILYIWLFSSVPGFELPKTYFLRMTNARWASSIEVMNRRLNQYDKTLAGLGLRDDHIFRSIFGMNEIPQEVRNAGFGGVNRYAYLDFLPDSSVLKKTSVLLDVLTKKAYVQSRSYDEVEKLSRMAGDMASCIPAVPPVLPDKSKFRVTSTFGYRSDPISGVTKFHSGYDFACKPGNPVYSSGDGVVEEVKFDLFGYGNSVLVDHGFGYKTRYAHLKTVYVAEGMTLRRGECLGETGNSGKSTGPHLHYEVIYRGNAVNPVNYFDIDMPLEEYSAMVKKVESESDNVMTGNIRRYSRR